MNGSVGVRYTQIGYPNTFTETRWRGVCWGTFGHKLVDSSNKNQSEAANSAAIFFAVLGRTFMYGSFAVFVETG